MHHSYIIWNKPFLHFMHLRVEIMCEIHFSDHKVVRIDWSLITRNPRVPDKVLVECDFKGHKKAFFTDFVICTLPLGYLKKHHESLFYPRLDSPKVRRKKRSIWQCCQLIKCGTQVKILNMTYRYIFGKSWQHCKC